MSQYRFTQLDVFTDQPFTGNPLAVYPEAEMLAVYVIVIAVLLLRPAGLFARATA